jgi:hypothetical protein
MSDKDLISREKLLHTLEGWLKLNARVVPTEIGKAVYMMIEDYPAVPQEMSAVEYEEAFQRITYEDVETYRAWLEAIHDEDWGRAVAIVEKWAKEHPEERSEE